MKNRCLNDVFMYCKGEPKKEDNPENLIPKCTMDKDTCGLYITTEEVLESIPSYFEFVARHEAESYETTVRTKVKEVVEEVVEEETKPRQVEMF